MRWHGQCIRESRCTSPFFAMGSHGRLFGLATSLKRDDFTCRMRLTAEKKTDGCEAWVRFYMLAVAPAGKLNLSFFHS